MPLIARPLRSVVITKFDNENVRTMAAVKQYAEARPAPTKANQISASEHPTTDTAEHAEP